MRSTGKAPVRLAESRRFWMALALGTSVLAAFACQRQQAARVPVVVRNPDYLVLRPIRRAPDAEHTIRVDLPYPGAGFGFASSAALLDLNSFEVGAAAFAGGRTSIVGEATIWLPLTPEGSRRLESWSANPGEDSLGIFLKGKLIAAPQVKSTISGGIPLRVANKSEGDRVLRELKNGGVSD